jgi:hypothetical protein
MKTKAARRWQSEQERNMNYNEIPQNWAFVVKAKALKMTGNVRDPGHRYMAANQYVAELQDGRPAVLVTHEGEACKDPHPLVEVGSVEDSITARKYYRDDQVLLPKEVAEKMFGLILDWSLGDAEAAAQVEDKYARQNAVQYLKLVKQLEKIDCGDMARISAVRDRMLKYTGPFKQARYYACSRLNKYLKCVRIAPAR